MTTRRAPAATIAGLVLCAAVAGCTTTAADDPPSPSQTAPRSSSMVPAAQRWWDDRTFYEIFVRSFADSDGDGIGDLRGVIDKLDHLNDGDPATNTDLGVTAIWLMPIFSSPSYHGYDVTDYRSVDPEYGTTEDLKELLAQAHERGINVILDLPLNHTSTAHPWFQSSRTGRGAHADWYVWRDGTSQETGPWGQQVWHVDGRRSYLGVFWEGMPDLNLRNAAVTAEIQDTARYWLDVGVDGFRLDGAQHLVEEDGVYANTAANKEWLTGFNAFVKSVRADALLVGEIWSNSDVSSAYVPDQVDIAFDFDSADAASSMASSGYADSLLSAAERHLRRYPDWQVGVFSDNHDRDRLASLAGDDPGRLRLIATWLLTAPGVPFVYYGQEIGLPGQKPDEQIRTPLPWSGEGPAAGFSTGIAWEPLQPGWEQRNIAAQQADPGSLWSQYSQLISVRNASPALRRGDFTSIDVPDPGFAYVRSLDDEHVLVVGNASGEPLTGLTVTLPAGTPQGTWTSLYGPRVAQPAGSAHQPVMRLEPWQTVVLSLG